MKNVKRFFKLFFNGLAVFGFDPRVMIRSFLDLPCYMRDYAILKKSASQSQKKGLFPFGRIWPCLGERSAPAGNSHSAYFYQDLHVAQRIFLNNPKRHMDVGSRIDGFVAHVAAFRKIFVLDIRPLNNDKLPNIDFTQCNLMGEIPKNLIESTDSLSCLHALEHFGLGRYGDPIHFEGHLLGLKNLVRILQPGGKLYVSVPIGKQRIEFNGQRVFSVRHLFELFNQDYRVDAFSYVDDLNNYHNNVAIAPMHVADNFGCNSGLGILELTKL